MRPSLLALLATPALLAATATLADPPAPPPGGDAAQAPAGRADDMALLLGLRPEQRPALDEFLGATMPPPPPGDGEAAGRKDHGDKDRGGPPDGAMMQTRMEAMQRFRATLSPDQQMRFDALERLRHGMGPRHRWGGPPPQE